jgi:hypothetical protein
MSKQNFFVGVLVNCNQEFKKKGAMLILFLTIGYAQYFISNIFLGSFSYRFIPHFFIN